MFCIDAQALAVVPWKATAVKAVRIIAELRLMRRIAEMNSRGVAPNSQMVAEMLVQEWPEHELQPGVNIWLARLPLDVKLRRRWLMRLRRFWGVHYRKLGSRAHLSPADQRRKALKKKTTSGSILGTTFDPTTGGQNGAIKVTVGIQKRLSRTQMWGRILAPSCGVKNWFQSMTWNGEAGLMLQCAEWLRKAPRLRCSGRQVF